uniref:Protein roadkill n=1 Tax=Lygus hesperus TaxID=30085 RepID=A0A0A9YG78_LYGHE
MSGSEDLSVNHPLADVRVVSGPVELRAHRVILEASSVVLRNELKTLLRLVKTPLTIEIKIKNPSDQKNPSTEIDKESLRRFLYFIYQGKIKDWGSSATTLLRLGYTYKMEKLMVLCDNQFLEMLPARNAIKYFILAKECDRHALKRKVADYIRTNICSIMVSKEWEKLEGNLKLLGEILVMGLPTPSVKGKSESGKRQTINGKILDAVTWEVDIRESKVTHTSILSVLNDRDQYVDIKVELGRSTRLGLEERFLELRSSVVLPTSYRPFPLVIAITIKTRDKGVISEKFLYTTCRPDNETKCIEILHNYTDFTPPNRFTLTVTMKACEYVHSQLLSHPFLRPARGETRFTDIKILVGEDCYPAHRIVLAAHSMFFQSCLTTTHDLKSTNFKMIEYLVTISRY